MISIILSTYNRAHTLKETIDSILKQTFRDFELLIIDDGSTDSTQELLASYDDERIRLYVLEQNQYYCAAANFGLTQAEGEYIAFATSDDTWEPDKLKLQMDYLKERRECAACFTMSDVMNEDGEATQEEFQMLSGLLIKNYHTQKEWIQHFIFEGNCLCHPSAVVRKSVMDEVGGYNLLFCQSADMDLWLRIIRRYPIHVIEKGLVHYRCYKDPNAQISGAAEMKAARFLNEHMIIRRNFINSLTDEEMIRFFGEHFQYPDAGSHIEIEIEKAFLLMNCAPSLPDFRILGIEKFEELLRIPEAVEVLKEKYKVKLQDIYRWNLGHFYLDFGIHVRMAAQDRKALLLKERFRKEEEYAGGLQKYRNELQERLLKADEELADKEEELADREEELKKRKERIENLLDEYKEIELLLNIKEKELLETKEKLIKTEALLDRALLEKLELEEQAEEKKKGNRKRR